MLARRRLTSSCRLDHLYHHRRHHRHWCRRRRRRGSSPSLSFNFVDAFMCVIVFMSAVVVAHRPHLQYRCLGRRRCCHHATSSCMLYTVVVHHRRNVATRFDDHVVTRTSDGVATMLQRRRHDIATITSYYSTSYCKTSECSTSYLDYAL